MSNPDPATRSLIWSDEWPASNGPSLRQGEETDDVLALSESLVLVRSSESSQLDAVNLVTGSWSPLDTFLSPYVPLRATSTGPPGFWPIALQTAEGSSFSPPRRPISIMGGWRPRVSST
ncbi:MAG: hypothetical protein JXP73_01840 [Deltaproteobacteria bacterium]|jgi:hypothetical protein|nr:hypothetical protein [Deltaproteobacteria bacterium]